MRARYDSDFCAANDVRSDTPYVNAYVSATALSIMISFYFPIAPYIAYVATAWLGAVFPASKYCVCYNVPNKHKHDGVLLTAAFWQLLDGAVAAHVDCVRPWVLEERLHDRRLPEYLS